jgi:ribose 5-phosphate isomerase RpiB
VRIAVINEVSAVERNADIVRALEGRGHELLNCGMTRGGAGPELSYIHTGFLAGLLLELGRVDFVVGGCGTGQGFMLSAMQYPGVACGHLLTPLDAFLFARINAGNCASLALNQGYGWAGDVNLRLVFDQLFTPERAKGYPPHREDPQRVARTALAALSRTTHRTMAEIVASLDEAVVGPALRFPGVQQLIYAAPISDRALATALQAKVPP